MWSTKQWDVDADAMDSKKQADKNKPVEVDLEEKQEYFRKTHNYELIDPQKVVLTFDNAELRNCDLIRLAPKTCMNDSMLNTFLKIFLAMGLSQDAKRDVHVFNTYFWKRLEAHALLVANTAKTRQGALLQMFEVYKTLSKVRRFIDDCSFINKSICSRRSICSFRFTDKAIGL